MDRPAVLVCAVLVFGCVYCTGGGYKVWLSYVCCWTRSFALIREQQWSSFTRVHAYSESLYGTSCLSAAVWEMAILICVHLSTSASMISKLLEVVFYVG